MEMFKMKLYGALIFLLTVSAGITQIKFTMQLYGALVLFFTFSAACGLRCYSCSVADSKSCTDIETCTAFFDRCYSVKQEGLNLVSKGCMTSQLCVAFMTCCEGDLCNGAVPAGLGVILLLLSSALITLLI